MAKKKEITKQEVLPPVESTPAPTPVPIPEPIIQDVSLAVEEWNFLTQGVFIGHYVNSLEDQYLFRHKESGVIYSIAGHKTITRALEILDFNTNLLMQLEALHTEQNMLYGFTISAE